MVLRLVQLLAARLLEDFQWRPKVVSLAVRAEIDALLEDDCFGEACSTYDNP